MHVESGRPRRGPNMEVSVDLLNASPDTAGQLAVVVTFAVGSLLIGVAVLTIWFGVAKVRQGAAAVGAAIIISGLVVGVTGTASTASSLADRFSGAGEETAVSGPRAQ